MTSTFAEPDNLEKNAFAEGRNSFGTKSLGSAFYGQFECTNRNHSGVLMMGNRALCFFGKLFSLERRLVMCYADINTIERYKSNGIKISMKAQTVPVGLTGVGEEHIFYINAQAFSSAPSGPTAQAASSTAAEDMNDILNLLLDLCERALGGFLLEDDFGEQTESATPAMKSPQPSAGSIASLRSSVKPVTHPLQRKSDTETESKGEEKVANEKRVRFSTTETEDQFQPQQRSPSQALALVAAMADFRSFSVALKDQRQANAMKRMTHDLGKEESAIACENGGVQGAAVNRDDEPEIGYELEGEPLNLVTAWNEVKEATTSTYKESALSDVELNCDLETFFSTFLLSHEYLLANNDKLVSASKWKKCRNKFVETRVISYIHPVNAPMAPPEAMAKKRQRLRKYGSRGICVDTSSEVQDVPLTDCFYLDDRLLVEANGHGGVTVNLRFEVRFIKSTMFRRIIERTTKDEFLKGTERFRQKMVEATPSEMVVEKKIVAPPVAGGYPLGPSAPPSVSKNLSISIIVALILILVFHFLLLLEIRSLGFNIRLFHGQIIELLESNSKSCLA